MDLKEKSNEMTSLLITVSFQSKTVAEKIMRGILTSVHSSVELG